MPWVAKPLARFTRARAMRQRQLVGEELVIGEALARRSARGEIRRRRRRMGGAQRLAPVGPAAAAFQARLDPFGQSGARASAACTARAIAFSVRPWVSG